MSTPFLLLLRSLVKPFYRQNAGFFLFLFLIFFGVVAPSQQPAYHYALILGMLDAPVFLGIVLTAWFLYALKCNNWVASCLQNPDFSFLNLLARLDKRRSFLWLLAVQIILILPVSLYALAVSSVAIYKGRYGVALMVQLYIILMPFLIYSLVLFGHGVLIYRCRELEEKRLLFYRGLPVSLPGRFIEFGWLYFLLSMPEMLTIGWLTPASVHLKDAFGFILSGYSVLLLLHSVLGVVPLKMGDFLKLSLGIFGILYACVLGDVLILLAGCFFVVAGGLFWWGYGRCRS